MSDDDGDGRFIDDIAADDDEPDAPEEEEGDDEYEQEAGDEDEDDGEPGGKRQRVVIEEDDALHAEMDQKREEEEYAKLQSDIERRYGGDGGEMEDYGKDETDPTQPIVTEILPGLKDPKLFIVACDPGKEQLAVLQLMNKFYTRARLPKVHGRELEEHERPLFTFSAFTTPASHGYVYIEAPKEVHVKRAVIGLRILKWWSIRLVRIEEMTEAVKIQTKVSTIRQKQWVRIKSGVYKNDLAYVVDIRDQATQVDVKLLPRLDYAEMQENFDLTEQGLKKKKRARGLRPLQRLFEKAKVQGFHKENVIFRKDGFDCFKSMRFKHGFYYRTIKSNGVLIDDVYPTKDEIEKFQQRNEDENSQDDMDDTISTLTKRAPVFVKEDRVKVINRNSDLFNLTGRVEKVLDGLVTVRPDKQHVMGDEGPRELPLTEFKPNEIKKFFEAGDHIKCINGGYKGETGFVLQVKEKEDSLVVHSDLSAMQMTLMCQDVIESAEISTGRDKTGGFVLHDLIQVGRDTVGVVVKCEEFSCHILTGNGVVKAVRLQEITRKRNSKFATALDGNGQEIQREDPVTVKSGRHRGKQGNIKHVFHSSVFMYSARHLDNTGIFVTQARNVEMMGAQRRVGADKKRQPRNVRTNFRSDPLFQKTVTILKGHYKGYLGIVVDIQDNQLRIELHAEEKTVTVERRRPDASDVVQVRDGTENKNRARLPGQRHDDFSDAGSRTPNYLGVNDYQDDFGESRAKTPAHAGLGGMTPSRDIGGMTPAHGGSWGEDSVWNTMTPARPSSTRVPVTPGGFAEEADVELNPRWNDDNEDNEDEEEEEEERKPIETPREDHHSIPTPRDVPRTPATPLTQVPSTPMMDTPHTPHDPPVPPTPTPNTPAIGSDWQTPHTPRETPHTPRETPHTPRETPHTPMMANDERSNTRFQPSTPFEAPPTPLHDTPYGIPTPHETPYETPHTAPETPRLPITPGITPGEGYDDETQYQPETPVPDHDDEEYGDDDSGGVFQPGVYVWLRAEGSDASGPIEDDEADLVMGYITNVSPGGKMAVEMEQGGKRTINARDTKPVVPEGRDDEVLIIEGDGVGQHGNIHNIHGGEVVVLTTTGEYAITVQENIVKYKHLSH